MYGKGTGEICKEAASRVRFLSEDLATIATKYAEINELRIQTIFGHVSYWGLYQTEQKNLAALNRIIDRLQDPRTRKEEIASLERMSRKMERKQ